jgi:hypothetical protein
MRVLIAPDCFGDTLTAVQAARAIADGWGQARPSDALTLAPQSDGGPGFVDVLASRLGERRRARVSGPLDATTDAQWVFDPRRPPPTSSAQACGLALLRTADRRHRRWPPTAAGWANWSMRRWPPVRAGSPSAWAAAPAPTAAAGWSTPSAGWRWRAAGWPGWISSPPPTSSTRCWGRWVRRGCSGRRRAPIRRPSSCWRNA